MTLSLVDLIEKLDAWAGHLNGAPRTEAFSDLNERADLLIQAAQWLRRLWAMEADQNDVRARAEASPEDVGEAGGLTNDQRQLLDQARATHARAMNVSDLADEGTWVAHKDVIDPPLHNYWRVSATRTPRKEGVASYPVTKALTREPAVAGLLTFISTALPQLCDIVERQAEALTCLSSELKEAREMVLCERKESIAASDAVIRQAEAAEAEVSRLREVLDDAQNTSGKIVKGSPGPLYSAGFSDGVKHVQAVIADALRSQEPEA